MTSLRRIAKAMLEGTLGYAPLARLCLQRRRGQRLVLSYHNVIASPRPLAEGDRSLHLPLSLFRAQLDTVAAFGVSVGSLLDGEPEIDAPPTVYFTFDDAYAGALELAVPELARRGWPCTVFVAPGILGASAPWWDRLADPEVGAVPRVIRDAALADLRGEGHRILVEAAGRGWTLMEPAPEHRIVTEQELVATADTFPLVSLGAHTWSHPNASALPRDELRQELEAPREWLHHRFPRRVCDHLAYPYGLQTLTTQKAAQAAGYSAAFRVTGGWDARQRNAFALPRLNVTPGLTAAGFRARLGGLLA